MVALARITSNSQLRGSRLAEEMGTMNIFLLIFRYTNNIHSQYIKLANNLIVIIVNSANEGGYLAVSFL